MARIPLYIKQADKLYRLYTFQLTTRGFYIIDNSFKADHFSYHNDGTCFHHLLGERKIKKIRPPLKEFKGPESFRVALLNISSLESIGKTVSEKGIVIERESPFCLEVILSNKPVELPEENERINREIIEREIGQLFLTIEVFDSNGTILPRSRFDNSYPP